MNKDIVVLVCDPTCGVASLGPGVRYDPTTRQILADSPVIEPPPPPPPPPVGKIHAPKSGAELQQAIDRAEGGDEIHLEPGVNYVGNFVLEAKAAAVVVRPIDLSPFVQGRRVNPSKQEAMGRLRSPNSMPALSITGSNWRLAGLDAGGVANTNHTVNVVLIGDEHAASLEALPENIDIDRCLIRGHAEHGTRRCLGIMGRKVRVRDSYLSDAFAYGNEAQAIGVFESQGVDIENSFLEGAGENFFVASIARVMRGVFPSDITLRRCHLFKRLEWRDAARKPIVKNIVEVKSGVRVLIEGNVLENNWPHAQSGYSVLLTCRDENNDGAAEIDATFRLNKLINVYNGWNILGRDDAAGNLGKLRAIIENNLVVGPIGRAFQMLNGIEELTVRNNTALEVGASIASSDGLKSQKLIFTGNAIGRGQYGIHHTGTGEGVRSLAAFWAEYDVTGNAFVGDPIPDWVPGAYPGNTFAAGVPAGVGVDLAALNAAIAGVVQ